MTNLLTLEPGALAEYQAWLGTIKQRIVSVRLRMALSSNLKFYLRFFKFHTGGQGVSDLDGATAPIGQQPIEQLTWGQILLKRVDEQPTIGLLLYRDKNNIDVELVTRERKKPMGVSEYTLVNSVPDNLKGVMPPVEEIKSDLKKLQRPNEASQ